MGKSHISGWASDSPTPAQLKEFFSQCEGPRPRITKERLQAFLRGGEQPSGYELARLILEQDFITPEEVAQARNVSYSDEQLKAFVASLPSEDFLHWGRDNGFMLVAGPPSPLSLLEIRDLKPEYFYEKSGGWYAEDREKFSRNDKVATAWLALSKEPVPDSTSKTWNKQVQLISGEEYVPNAAEAAWGFTTYKEVRRICLVPNICVRTSSLDSDGSRVGVGDFGVKGLHVNGYWDGPPLSGLGLASARKSKIVKP